MEIERKKKTDEGERMKKRQMFKKDRQTGRNEGQIIEREKEGGMKREGRKEGSMNRR